MIGYQYHDGGRSEAGYRGEANDCVARALSIMTGESYQQVYLELARANKASGKARSARNPIRNEVWQPVYESYGLRKVKLPPGKSRTIAKSGKEVYKDREVRYGSVRIWKRRNLCSSVWSRCRTPGGPGESGIPFRLFCG